MTQCTLPSSIMTDSENDESFSALLATDSDMSMNVLYQGELTFNNIFSDLDEEEGEMDDNPSYSAIGGKKGKEESPSDEESDELDEEEGDMDDNPSSPSDEESDESSVDSNGESDEEPAPKKRKKEDDSSYENDNSSSEEDADDEDDDDMISENASDDDMIEKELDLPANRNRKVKGRAVEPNHYRRNIQRNMAAQGLYENRDVTQLTCIVATSPRLKAILDENLPRWRPSLILLVRSTRPPRLLRSCRLLSSCRHSLFCSVDSFLL
jgi:hypothetical protein